MKHNIFPSCTKLIKLNPGSGIIRKYFRQANENDVHDIKNMALVNFANIVVSSNPCQ